ncbi:hypothetical protein Scep_003584 [Stephania cephalantha]|uniref:Uncharacterized protein n=1 Tax=Stephania cephalantha TaxID=152367 RepID=A0AAP0KRQ2_9MAGN
MPLDYKGKKKQLRHSESPWLLSEDYGGKASDVAVAYLDSLKMAVESDSRSLQCLQSRVGEVGSGLRPAVSTLSCALA